MHTFFGLWWSLVSWTLRRVSACWTVGGDKGGGLAIENGSTVWVDRWDGECFATAQ